MFEYNEGKLTSIEQRNRLETFLKEIWKNRYVAYSDSLNVDEFEDNENYKQLKQPFLRFDGKNYFTQNYVGFIQFEDLTIEIYPKVFNSKGLPVEQMLRHLFFWFNYCRRIHFPVLDSSLDKLNADSIPELLIWNYADYCERIITTQPFSRYEEVEEVLYSPKGKIDFPAYIKNGLSNGNNHHIDCIHEPFLFNNKLNQSIKYVSRLLMDVSKIKENQNKLQQIIFTLDDVDDIPCNSSELEKVVVSQIFSDYYPIIEWCKRVLDQQLYSNSAYNSLQWSLLLPMEYVFEDFIAGFMEKHFSTWFDIKYQKSNYYLTTNNVFQMQHDIYLTRKGTNEIIIIDTKYKVRENQEDKKKGVSQADMYQMVSYAYRRNCQKIILMYPNSSETLKEDSAFKIATDIIGSPEIEIKICEVPFWNNGNIDNVKINLETKLKNILEIKD